MHTGWGLGWLARSAPAGGKARAEYEALMSRLLDEKLKAAERINEMNELVERLQRGAAAGAAAVAAAGGGGGSTAAPGGRRASSDAHAVVTVPRGVLYRVQAHASEVRVGGRLCTRIDSADATGALCLRR